MNEQEIDTLATNGLDDRTGRKRGMCVCLRRLILPLFILSVFASTGSSAEPSTEALLKARIIQLEAQVAEAVRRINLLAAQLSEAQQHASRPAKIESKT